MQANSSNVSSDPPTQQQPVAAAAATVAPPPPQWVAMQYPAAAMVMQHHMIPPPHYPAHYLPYHPHIQQQQQHHPSANQQQGSAGENRTIWVGDLHNWMDEDYLRNCFASTGEVNHPFRVYIFLFCSLLYGCCRLWCVFEFKVLVCWMFTVYCIY